MQSTTTDSDRPEPATPWVTAKPQRTERLAQALEKAGVDAALVTAPSNIAYFSGFRTSLYSRFNGVFVRPGSAPCLVTSLVDELIAKDQVTGPVWIRDIRIHGAGKRTDLFPTPLAALQGELSSIKRLGVDDMSLSAYRDLTNAFPNLEIVSIASHLDALRAQKDVEEIAAIRKATEIALRCLRRAQEVLAWPNVSSAQLSAELDAGARLAGADGFGFPALISYGARMKAAHAVATFDRIPRDVPSIRLAYAPSYQGYMSSVCRTYCRRPMPDILQRYSDAFFAAMMAVRDAARPGATIGDLHAAIEHAYRKDGVFEYWNGEFGYGVGLQVQEPPRLSRNNPKYVLVEGMTLSVRPNLSGPAPNALFHGDMLLVGRERSEYLVQDTQEVLYLD